MPAQERIIDINEVPTDGSKFSPKDKEVAVGDLVYWRNNTDEPHRPAPEGGPDNAWMDYPIPDKLPDEPPPTSQQAVTGYPAGTTVKYYCAEHPNRGEEKGTLEFKAT